MFGKWVAGLVTASVGVSLAAAPAAVAGSIVFVKDDGNVYLVDDRGGSERQVTRTGGYSEVSQADDGTIVASKSSSTLTGKLALLQRSGALIKEINVSGPVLDVQISPDGRTIAYGRSFAPTGTGTAFVRADGTTLPAMAFARASWLTNDRLVATSGDVWTHDLSSDTSTQWFRGTSPPNQDLVNDDDVEINPAGTGMASARATGLGFYVLNGPPPAAPTFIDCEIAGSAFKSPSWSPTIANTLVAESGGELSRIVVAPLRADVPCDAAFATVTTMGKGTSPDWGPAAVGGAGGAAGVPKITAVKVKGKVLTVTLSAAGAITVDVTRGAKKLGQIARFGTKGANVISLAKVSSKQLKAGRYKAKVTAVTAAGRSASRTVFFTVR